MKKNVPVQRLLLKVMQITFIQLLLSVVFCMASFAHETRAQELLSREVSLQMESAELKQILNRIEKQVKVRFVYSSQSIPLNQKASVNAVKSRLSKVLDELFHPLQVEYEEIDSKKEDGSAGNIPAGGPHAGS